MDDKTEIIFNAKAMERQSLHNTALVLLYHPELRYDNDLRDAAKRYLINLLVTSLDDMGKAV